MLILKNSFRVGLTNSRVRRGSTKEGSGE